MALDVGAKRIGVATASAVARIASPRITLQHTDQILHQLQELIKECNAAMLVVGLPRGLNGQRTAQTEAVEAFVQTMQKNISLPVHWQDEAVTSRQAEAELTARGKKYQKEDIDALAATYILEDFLNEHPEVRA
jgi:putative holliday junction resolvase